MILDFISLEKWAIYSFSKNITYLILRKLSKSCGYTLENNLPRQWDFLSGRQRWGSWHKWRLGWLRCQGKQSSSITFLPQTVYPPVRFPLDDLHMKGSLKCFRRPGHLTFLLRMMCTVLYLSSPRKNCSLDVFYRSIIHRVERTKREHENLICDYWIVMLRKLWFFILPEREMYLLLNLLSQVKRVSTFNILLTVNIGMVYW